MKLHYFDSMGRAESARIMFELGGVTYEDIRFDREKWATEYKPKSTTGQAPFLELNDGTIICQSTAIAVYAAEMAGLWPSELVQRAKTLELVACFDELMVVMGPTFDITDIDDRTAARQNMMKPGGKLHKHFEAIDKLLAKSSTQYYLGADMGLADTVVFVGACQLGGGLRPTYRVIDGINKADFYQFKHIKRIRDAVAHHPFIVARYKDVEEKHAAFKADASS